MDYIESEIELLKCTTSKQVKAFLEKHQNEKSNPFVAKAKIKYDDLFYKESSGSISKLNKYLAEFPNGLHCEDAKKMIENLKLKQLIRESEKRERKEKFKEKKEAIGFWICFVLFALSFGGCLIKGLDIGESFAIQGAIVPLYYTITKICEKKD